MGVGGCGAVGRVLITLWALSCIFSYPSRRRGYGSMMVQEAVAVVRTLVLLLRLSRFPESDGFAELRSLFRVSVYTLDAYFFFGLCVDVPDPVQRFVVETTLQVERSWVNWGLVSAARLRLFGHWLNFGACVACDRDDAWPPSCSFCRRVFCVCGRMALSGRWVLTCAKRPRMLTAHERKGSAVDYTPHFVHLDTYHISPANKTHRGGKKVCGRATGPPFSVQKRAPVFMPKKLVKMLNPCENARDGHIEICPNGADFIRPLA